MSWSILTVVIKREHDIVAARQRARQIARSLGFDAQDQTRIATAVSEIARNAYTYAKGGKVEFLIEGQTAPQVFLIRITDDGAGINNLQTILDGQYKSATGMGLGIIGTRRLVDRFHIESDSNKGTSVYLRKLFPKHAPVVTTTLLQKITNTLAQERSNDPLAEVQQQNQELIHTLEQLQQRQDELLRLNRELEDTNRGVVALYAELDEKADHLRRADEMKSRFLSNMSHEFRTPLNSQLALTRILLDRSDGDLTDEQEKQIQFIRKGAESLYELVNDLLDLAKIEAGKIEIHPVEFQIENLFSALRGMLRPLLVNESVNLVFEEPEEIPPLFTDEGKVSQILRNFLSNSIKFTERGEVRVSARMSQVEDSVILDVSDTGIGIDAADQSRIFEEFTQIQSPQQRRVKGTGLGLPLCRKLAELLGGSVSVHSQLGMGSTFTASIPIVFHQENENITVVLSAPAKNEESQLPLVLIVEDNDELLFAYQKYLEGTDFRFQIARSLREARAAVNRLQPDAIILDILLRGENTWDFLAKMKEDDLTSSIPILIVTDVEDRQKGLALGADAYCLKPIERETLLTQLQSLTAPDKQRKVLIIDDDEATRYLYKKLLAGTDYTLLETANGIEGVRIAQSEQPQIIILDMTMPEISGMEVLRQLKSESLTSVIPVIVATSKVLEYNERIEIEERSAALLSKSNLSRDELLRAIKESLDVPSYNI